MTQERMAPGAPYTYEHYKAAGWTDEQLIAHGHMLPETSYAAVDSDGRLRLLLDRIERLRLLLDCIERLREKKKSIADDERDVFSEAKAVGYDTEIMREILKLRAMRPDDRREMEMLLDTYKSALGLD